MMSFSLFFRTLAYSGALLLFISCSTENTNQQTDMKSIETSVAETTTEPPQKAKKRIVFFGDSLTAGYGLDEEYSFPSLIQAKLDSLALDYEAINAGLSGETSAGGLNRIDWVMQQSVDVFILELGGNDALRGFDLSTTRKNLQGIIDKVKAAYPDVTLIIAGMEAPPNMGNDYTQEFRTIYPQLAANNDAALIPFLLKDVGGISELNLPDMIHPNKKGQVIVANNIWTILQQQL